MLADDITCFLSGSDDSFHNLFTTLDTFGICSGCKLNFSKSEAIWIGSKREIKIVLIGIKVSFEKIGKFLLNVLFVIIPETTSHIFCNCDIVKPIWGGGGGRLFRLLKPNMTLTLICQPLIKIFWCALR